MNSENKADTKQNEITNVYSQSEQFMIYIIMILFAFYPYSMEFLFQTPIALLSNGSFFLIQHVDSLTSLPNVYRFNKDLHLTKVNQWKCGLIVTNIRGFSKLNLQYGWACANRTLIRFLQRILFEIEDFSSHKFKLYRFDDDRFGIMTDFTDKQEFKAFVKNLSQIEVVVLRPADFDATQQKKIHKKFVSALDFLWSFFVLFCFVFCFVVRKKLCFCIYFFIMKYCDE
jgi:GGDEF domain-containing protein